MNQYILGHFGHKFVSAVTAVSYLFSTFSTCFAEIPYLESEGQEWRACDFTQKNKRVLLDEQFARENHQSDWVFKVTQEGEDVRLSAYERFRDSQFVERFSSVASKNDSGLRAFALERSYNNFSKRESTHNQLELSVGWDGTLRIKGLQAQQQRLGFSSFGAIEFEDGLQAQEVTALAPRIIHKAKESKVERFDIWGLSFLNSAQSTLELQDLRVHHGQMLNEGKLHFQGEQEGLLKLNGASHELLGEIKAKNLKVKSQDAFIYNTNTFDVSENATFKFKQAVTLAQDLNLLGHLRVKAPEITIAAQAQISARKGAELHSTTKNAVEGTRIYGKLVSEGDIISRGNTRLSDGSIESNALIELKGDFHSLKGTLKGKGATVHATTPSRLIYHPETFKGLSALEMFFEDSGILRDDINVAGPLSLVGPKAVTVQGNLNVSRVDAQVPELKVVSDKDLILQPEVRAQGILEVQAPRVTTLNSLRAEFLKINSAGDLTLHKAYTGNQGIELAMAGAFSYAKLGLWTQGLLQITSSHERLAFKNSLSLPGHLKAVAPDIHVAPKVTLFSEKQCDLRLTPSPASTGEKAIRIEGKVLSDGYILVEGMTYLWNGTLKSLRSIHMDGSFHGLEGVVKAPEVTLKTDKELNHRLKTFKDVELLKIIFKDTGKLIKDLEMDGDLILEAPQEILIQSSIKAPLLTARVPQLKIMSDLKIKKLEAETEALKIQSDRKLTLSYNIRTGGTLDVTAPALSISENVEIASKKKCQLSIPVVNAASYVDGNEAFLNCEGTILSEDDVQLNGNVILRKAAQIRSNKTIFLHGNRHNLGKNDGFTGKIRGEKVEIKARNPNEFWYNAQVFKDLTQLKLKLMQGGKLWQPLEMPEGDLTLEGAHFEITADFNINHLEALTPSLTYNWQRRLSLPYSISAQGVLDVKAPEVTVSESWQAKSLKIKTTENMNLNVPCQGKNSIDLDVEKQLAYQEQGLITNGKLTIISKNPSLNFYRSLTVPKLEATAPHVAVYANVVLAAQNGIKIKVPLQKDNAMGIVCVGKASCEKDILFEGNVVVGEKAVLESNTTIQLNGNTHKVWGMLRGNKAVIYGRSLDDLKYQTYSFRDLNEVNLKMRRGGTINKNLVTKGAVNIELPAATKSQVTTKAPIRADGGFRAHVPGGVFNTQNSIQSKRQIAVTARQQNLKGQMITPRASLKARTVNDLTYGANTFKRTNNLHLFFQNGGAFTRPIRVGGNLTVELGKNATRDIINRTTLQAKKSISFSVGKRKLINEKKVTYKNGRYIAHPGGDIIAGDWFHIEGRGLENKLGHIRSRHALIDVTDTFYHSGVMKVKGTLINNARHTVIEQLQRKWEERVTIKCEKKKKRKKKIYERTITRECSENLPDHLSGLMQAGTLLMGQGKYKRPQTYRQTGGHVRAGEMQIDLKGLMDFQHLREQRFKHYKIYDRGYKEKGAVIQNSFRSAVFGAEKSMKVKAGKIRLNGSYIYSLDPKAALRIEAKNGIVFDSVRVKEYSAPRTHRQKKSTYRVQQWQEVAPQNILQAKSKHAQVSSSHGNITGFKPDALDTKVNYKAKHKNLRSLDLAHGEKVDLMYVKQSKRGKIASLVSMAAGIGLNFILPGAGTVAATMGNAAASTLGSQFVGNMIINKGNIGRSFKALASEDSLRSLLVTVGTAGAMRGLNMPARPQGFMQQLHVNGTRAAISTGLNVVVDPKHAGRALRLGALNLAVNTLAGTAANKIGASYNNGDGNIDYITHKVLHGVVGAAAGAALSKDHAAGAVAGAGGAVVAEVVGEMMMGDVGAKVRELKQEGLSDNQVHQRLMEQANLNADLGRLAGAAMAAATRQDVNVAAMAASNAVDNNLVQAIPIAITAGLAAYAAYDVYDTYKKEGPQAALTKAGVEVVMAAAGATAIKAGYKVAGIVYPTAEAAWAAYVASNPRVMRLAQASAPAVSAVRNMASRAIETAQNSSVGRRLANAEAACERWVNKGLSKLGVRTNIVDANIKWGKGIERQGMPWEDYLASRLPAESRLPKNHNVFDFFDRVTGEALSAKTINTLTKSKLDDPSRVYYSLKKNIDAAFNFEKSNVVVGGVKVDKITSRTVHVAVPTQTTLAQWGQIKRAIEYAKIKNIFLRITEVL